MIRTESILKDLFENPKNVVIVTDAQYHIRYVSDTVTHIFGVNPFAVLGKNAFDFVADENSARWQACLSESNHGKSCEISLRSKSNEELHFDVTVTNHVNNVDIRGLVIFMHDITQRKRDLKELQKANHHLDHFIFKTTHDLRAPLHSALGLVKLAESAPQEEQQKYLALIRKSLLKLDGFIEEVNNFYKNDKLAVKREEINLQQLVHSEVESLRNLPEADGIFFDHAIEATAAFISDPIRIKTVLTNIVSNSIKYSDPAKPLRFIKIQADVSMHNAVIRIYDNGQGIASEYLEKIYDIFFRANDTTAGTGLGLYIVKDTVERLNGKIQVSSELGKGTQFTVTIPNQVLHVQPAKPAA